MNDRTPSRFLRWIVGGYYFLAIVVPMFGTYVESGEPIQWGNLVWFGIIPAGAGIVGILTSQWHGERVLVWWVFLAGIVGIVLSVVPLRRAIWRWTLGKLWEWILGYR